MRGQRKKRGETKHLTVYLKYFKYKFQYLTAPADRKRSPDSTATTTDTESEYGSGKGTRGAGTQARRAEMIHRPSCCRPKTAMGPQKKKVSSAAVRSFGSNHKNVENICVSTYLH